MRVRITGVWLASVVVLAIIMGSASASPISRPVPLAKTAHPILQNALHQKPWNSAPTILTSEYEYHEPTNQPKNQQYGSNVALSSDGRTLAVTDLWYFGGSEWPWYGSGAVYVYRRSSNGWILEAKLEPPAARGYDFFGSDVALNMTGDVLAVGSEFEGYEAPSQAPGPGTVFVYKRSGGVWTPEATLRASRPRDAASFGRTVEINAWGNEIAVGAPYESLVSDAGTLSAAGAVYVFAKTNGAWVEQQALSAPVPESNDLFGFGVRLSENGRALAVLAAEQNFQTEDLDLGGWPGRVNTVYVFERQAGTWNVSLQLEGSLSEPHFGSSFYEADGQTEGFDLSADGRTLAIGSPFAAAPDGGSGLVRIYRRSAQQWLPTGTVLTPTGLADRRSFGRRLTLSATGRSLVAFADRDDGLYGHPYVMAFDLQRNRWQQTGVFESPVAVQIASGFGNALALSWNGDRLVLGARLYSNETSYWGAVFDYRRQSRR